MPVCVNNLKIEFGGLPNMNKSRGDNGLKEVLDEELRQRIRKYYYSAGYFEAGQLDYQM